MKGMKTKSGRIENEKEKLRFENWQLIFFCIRCFELGSCSQKTELKEGLLLVYYCYNHSKHEAMTLFVTFWTSKSTVSLCELIDQWVFVSTSSLFHGTTVDISLRRKTKEHGILNPGSYLSVQGFGVKKLMYGLIPLKSLINTDCWACLG